MATPTAAVAPATPITSDLLQPLPKKSENKKKKKKDNNEDTPTAGSWFIKFHPFVYDHTAPLEDNFYRLAAERKWGEKLTRKRWAQCQIEEFGNAYGTDTTKLEAWQSLCREVRIEGPMTSITQCRKVS